MARLQTLKHRLASVPVKLQTIQPGSWRTNKQSSTARGYGYKWQKAREEFLSTYRYCVYCARAVGITVAFTNPEYIGLCIRAGVGKAEVVDHIEPQRGDDAVFWDRANWQPLCKSHHSSDKQREEAQG